MELQDSTIFPGLEITLIIPRIPETVGFIQFYNFLSFLFSFFFGRSDSKNNLHLGFFQNLHEVYVNRRSGALFDFFVLLFLFSMAVNIQTAAPEIQMEDLQKCQGDMHH